MAASKILRKAKARAEAIEGGSILAITRPDHRAAGGWLVLARLDAARWATIAGPLRSETEAKAELAAIQQEQEAAGWILHRRANRGIGA